MREFISRNFSTILIALLAFLLLWHRQPAPAPQQPTITIVRDTQWLPYASQLPAYQPIIIRTQPPAAVPPAYQPDTTYAGLLAQFQRLLDAHLTTTVQADTIRLDTLGHVAILDSVRENRIVSRSAAYSWRLPVVTNTVTIQEPYKPTRGLYIGGGLTAGTDYAITGIDGGLMLRTKRDQLLGLRIGFSPLTGPTAGLQAYWPLTPRR